jgi:hypothetical protein
MSEQSLNDLMNRFENLPSQLKIMIREEYNRELSRRNGSKDGTILQRHQYAIEALIRDWYHDNPVLWMLACSYFESVPKDILILMNGSFLTERLVTASGSQGAASVSFEDMNQFKSIGFHVQLILQMLRRAQRDASYMQRLKDESIRGIEIFLNPEVKDSLTKQMTAPFHITEANVSIIQTETFKLRAIDLSVGHVYSLILQLNMPLEGLPEPLVDCVTSARSQISRIKHDTLSEANNFARFLFQSELDLMEPMQELYDVLKQRLTNKATVAEVEAKES